MHPDNRRQSGAHQGLVEAAALPCHAQRTAVLNAATRGGLHSLCAHAARTPLHSHPAPRARRPDPNRS